MSPRNIAYLQQEIELECRRLQHWFSDLPLTPQNATQQFQQLDCYRAQLRAAMGEKRASAMIHDLYTKASRDMKKDEHPEKQPEPQKRPSSEQVQGIKRKLRMFLKKLPPLLRRGKIPSQADGEDHPHTHS
jgi:hypothetical protein